MTSSHSDRQPTQSKARPCRFRIEKLEERIAPAKGGTTGKPAYHDPPGQHCYYGTCCPNGHHGCRI